MADPNTFVFETKIKEWLKMISVDAKGKITGYGQIGPDNDARIVTKANWESSAKLSLDYNVEDVNMACVGMNICKLQSHYQGVLMLVLLTGPGYYEYSNGFYIFRSNNTQTNI